MVYCCAGHSPPINSSTNLKRIEIVFITSLAVASMNPDDPVESVERAALTHCDWPNGIVSALNVNKSNGAAWRNVQPLRQRVERILQRTILRSRSAIAVHV